jgi:hypothetical protein
MLKIISLVHGAVCLMQELILLITKLLLKNNNAYLQSGSCQIINQTLKNNLQKSKILIIYFN